MSPFDVLAALPLVVLLIAGRASPRRQLLLVAVGAVVAALAVQIVYLFSLPHAASILAYDLAFEAAEMLILASWALLLNAAARAGQVGWLLVAAALVALTQGVPLLLEAALAHALWILGPVAALALAWSLPARPRATGATA